MSRRLLSTLLLSSCVAAACSAGCGSGSGVGRWQLPPAAVPGSRAGAGSLAGSSPVGVAGGRELPLAAFAPAGPPQVEPLPLADPFRLLVEAVRRQQRIRTVQGFVDQKLSVGGEQLDSQIRFVYARPDILRHEHLVPLRQVLLVRDGTVWVRTETASARGAGAAPGGAGAGAGGRGAAAAQGEGWTTRPLARMSPWERASLGLQPGYGFDPLGSLPVDSYRFAFLRCGPHHALVKAWPAAAESALPTLLIDVEPGRAVIVRIRYFADTGASRPLATEQFADFELAVPGVLFPRRHLVRWSSPGGELVLERRMRALRFDLPVPEALLAPPR